jgi:hypothetical protein
MTPVNAIRFFLTFACVSVAQITSASDASFLVSDAEYAQEKQVEANLPKSGQLTAKSVPVPGAPVIELQKPKMQETLKAPFPIQLAFKTNDGADVDLDSFKVLYGFMKLDITDRVVHNAKLSKEGLSVDNANIPAGNHKLILQLRDSKNRKTEVTMNFTVE